MTPCLRLVWRCCMLSVYVCWVHRTSTWERTVWSGYEVQVLLTFVDPAGTMERKERQVCPSQKLSPLLWNLKSVSLLLNQTLCPQCLFLDKVMQQDYWTGTTLLFKSHGYCCTPVKSSCRTIHARIIAISKYLIVSTHLSSIPMECPTLATSIVEQSGWVFRNYLLACCCNCKSIALHPLFEYGRDFGLLQPSMHCRPIIFSFSLVWWGLIVNCTSSISINSKYCRTLQAEATSEEDRSPWLP